MSAEEFSTPVTLIEGHLELEVVLEEAGKRVREVLLKAWGFRGFEKLLVGLGAESIPRVAQRICGVCPVAHHVAAAKAINKALGIEIPDYAELITKIINLHGVAQSHLLHTGFMALPDMYRVKSISQILEKRKEVVDNSIRALTNSQRIVSILGGRQVHPVTLVPGGVSYTPSREDIEAVEKACREGIDSLKKLVDEVLEDYTKYLEEVNKSMKYTSTYYVALRGSEPLEFYDGDIIVLHRRQLVSSFKPHMYQDYIEEETVDYSYSKLTKVIVGREKHMFRVGPLARIYGLKDPGYDLSREIYEAFNKLNKEYPENPLLYTMARLVEIAYCFERTLDILEELKKTSIKPRVHVEPRRGEGVAAVEAPRGLLVHHYKLNNSGVVEYANIITPTVHNLRPMEEDVRKTAYSYIDSNGFKKHEYETIAKTIVRAYDPCISCSTHFVKIKTI